MEPSKDDTLLFFPSCDQSSSIPKYLLFNNENVFRYSEDSAIVMGGHYYRCIGRSNCPKSVLVADEKIVFHFHDHNPSKCIGKEGAPAVTSTVISLCSKKIYTPSRRVAEVFQRGSQLRACLVCRFFYCIKKLQSK